MPDGLNHGVATRESRQRRRLGQEQRAGVAGLILVVTVGGAAGREASPDRLRLDGAIDLHQLPRCPVPREENLGEKEVLRERRDRGRAAIAKELRDLLNGLRDLVDGNSTDQEIGLHVEGVCDLPKDSIPVGIPRPIQIGVVGVGGDLLGLREVDLHHPQRNRLVVSGQNHPLGSPESPRPRQEGTDGLGEIVRAGIVGPNRGKGSDYGRVARAGVVVGERLKCRCKRVGREDHPLHRGTGE